MITGWIREWIKRKVELRLKQSSWMMRDGIIPDEERERERQRE